MIPKDLQEQELTFGIVTENGFQELGEISQCPIVELTAPSVSENLPMDFQPHEVSFDFNPELPDGMTSDDLWLVLCGVCTMKQVMQNNWRRMHGLPMKDRMKYGKAAT